jgi:hypothetical protein
MALLIFAILTTVLFSVIFLPIFFAAWRQEEERWNRRTRQVAAIPMFIDRRK